MSVSLEVVAVAKNSKHSRCLTNGLINSNHKRILRSKENLFKPKCNKELKKKLRKYKLRRDGSEDPEVLDVSQILVNSLRIKSPNNPEKLNNNNLEGGEIKPSNYLFKMVRKRKIYTQIDCSNESVSMQQNCNLHSVSPDEDTHNNKQTNAFQLMMDSRNKSIGGNSPGKEKSSDEYVLEEIIEKKAIKAKRILSLQKMAESKGSLKNKEIEDYREKAVKKKMLKRAVKLKDMITKPDGKFDQKDEVVTSFNSDSLSESQLNNDVGKQARSLVQNNKELKLCDILINTDTMINENKPLSRVSDKDIEFLQKLSPSIRKKENMLCYFQKVSKETEFTCEQPENTEEVCNSIIKVKLRPKRKKKVKKLKSSQNEFAIVSDDKNDSEDLTNKNSNQLDNNKSTEYVERKKRKRDQQFEKDLNLIQEVYDNIEPDNNENRPKRMIKKPVKYTEDVHCFSSDEELHIFTPKKKRNSDKDLKSKTNKNNQNIDQQLNNKEIFNGKKENEIKLKLSNQSNIKTNSSQDSKIKLKAIKNSEMTKTVKIEENRNQNHVKVDKEKKSVKLAPIFVTKGQLSLEAIEAKQKFLKSGIPVKLKKNIMPQTNNVTLFESFHTVLHIQQNIYDNKFNEKDWFKLSKEMDENDFNIQNYTFKEFLTKLSPETINFPFFQYKPDKFLKCIKEAYPKFPVYRTYHRLKSKSKEDFKDWNYTNLDNSADIIDNCTEENNDNLEKLNWCDKYKPTSSKQIIGNFESVKELKRWLETWSEKLKKSKNNASDESDMSDFCYSDMDSGDATRAANNVLILTGPTGSGKTSSVYAVAAELAIKVIEVNASSKRNGKIMLQDLQEATQSHKVDRAKSGSESSQKLQEVPILISKKRGRPKKSQEVVITKKVISKSQSISETLSQPTLSQDCVRTGMSLILIDDADIVFDQDDGFCSAISQLIHSSKRPVILVTSSMSCPHLQRFIQNGKILHMHPLLPRMLGTWLDIMCLADIGKCYMGLGERLLDFYKGDIRKSINCLQFYMNSYRNTKQTEDVVLAQVKFQIDDENSSMSWNDTENLEDISSYQNNSHHIDKQLQFLRYGSTNVFDIWWSLASHFNSIKNEDNKESHLESHFKKSRESDEIKKIAAVLETLSIVDYIGHSKPDTRSNITSKPWYCNEGTSLLENENFDNYNEANYVGEDISNMLMKCAVSEVQTIFNIEKDICIQPPTMGSHRERDRLVSQHSTLSRYLNPASVLDRRATAMDYWPSCRTLCRLEKNKTDYSFKRNNRFCHYLKSLNILCKNDFFDNLADSLN